MSLQLLLVARNVSGKLIDHKWPHTQSLPIRRSGQSDLGVGDLRVRVDAVVNAYQRETNSLVCSEQSRMDATRV